MSSSLPEIAEPLRKAFKIRFDSIFRQELLNYIASTSISTDAMQHTKSFIGSTEISALETYATKMNSETGNDFIKDKLLPELRMSYKNTVFTIMDHVMMMTMKKTVQEIFEKLNQKFNFTLQLLETDAALVVEFLESTFHHPIEPTYTQQAIGLSGIPRFLSMEKTMADGFPQILFAAALRLIKKDPGVVKEIVRGLKVWFDQCDILNLFRLLYFENLQSTNDYKHAIESDIHAYSVQIILLSKLNEVKLPQKSINPIDYALTYEESIYTTSEELQNRRLYLIEARLVEKKIRFEEESRSLAIIDENERLAEKEKREKDEEEAATSDFYRLSPKAQAEYFKGVGGPYFHYAQTTESILQRFREKRIEDYLDREGTGAEIGEEITAVKKNSQSKSTKKEFKLQQQKIEKEAMEKKVIEDEGAYVRRVAKFATILLATEVRFKELDREKLKIRALLYLLSNEKLGAAEVQGSELVSTEDEIGTGELVAKKSKSKLKRNFKLCGTLCCSLLLIILVFVFLFLYTQASEIVYEQRLELAEMRSQRDIKLEHKKLVIERRKRVEAEEKFETLADLCQSIIIKEPTQRE